MDEFTDTVQAGAQELAERIMPAPATAVRARGEHLRHRRTVGSIALATAGVAVIGATAFATFGGAGNRTSQPVVPGNTSTSAPVLSTPTIAPSPTTPTTATTPSTPSTSSPSSSTTSTGASKPPPIHVPTTSSHTSSSPSTPAACNAADLAVSSSPWTGRTGHVIGIFLFHNTSATACRISGYPLVSGVDGQGAVTTTATHTLKGWAGNLSSVPTVDIPPGGYASAGVEWQNSTIDGSACARVSAFEVAPPSGGTPTKIVPGKASETDGPACANFQIHPVVAGFDSSFFYPPYTPPSTSSK